MCHACEWYRQTVVTTAIRLRCPDDRSVANELVAPASPAPTVPMNALLVNMTQFPVAVGYGAGPTSYERTHALPVLISVKLLLKLLRYHTIPHFPNESRSDAGDSSSLGRNRTASASTSKWLTGSITSYSG
jgi:hypothetical protein